AGGLAVGLRRVGQLLRRGLEETAPWWPAVRAASRWVKRVARSLRNRDGRPAAWVRRRLTQLLSQIRQAAAGTAEAAVRQQLRHFVKVTQSYWPGLFACYGSADIPRTNNDLEHLLG